MIKGFGSLMDGFGRAPEIKPCLNIGCLFDIPTGKYVEGKHGESILNGGLYYITGIAGRGNTYKSTIAHFMLLRSLGRYTSSLGMIYDTEVSLSYQRIDSLAQKIPPFNYMPATESGRLQITDKTLVMSEKWFEAYRSLMNSRLNPKDADEREMAKKLTTPFLQSDGTQIKTFNPFLVEVDSLSRMDSEMLDNVYDKVQIGDSKLNMEAMTINRVKNQMITQLPGLTGKAGSYMIMTAHVGDEYQLDPYSPPAKKLTFLKGKAKFKNVPEQFTFLTNNLWHSLSSTVLINQGTKAPEFPRNKEDDLKGDTDLMLITLVNLRAKGGATGMTTEIVVSQQEGVEVGLTEFLYIKNHGRFGIGGNKQHFHLDLVPDISMQRTTVRSVINGNENIKRALEITSELCQMKNLWHDMEEGLLKEPAEIYKTLSDKGYDWNTLLTETRGYWVYEEAAKEEPKHFLSTMDILKMCKGTYHPYWYDAVAKKKDLPAVKLDKK